MVYNQDERLVMDDVAQQRKNDKKKKKKAAKHKKAGSKSILDNLHTKDKKETSRPIPQMVENDNGTSAPIDDDCNTEKDNYPYPVQPDDHCETPMEAYQDLLPLLALLAQSKHKTLSDLQIYDPYFCEGSMVERLASLGLRNVYNRKEDFYSKIAARDVPPHDLLITNPPYSLDHMERMFQYMWTSTRPFCLLLPNYVYMKDYLYKSPHLHKLFFVVPTTRYLYTTPKGRRQQKSSKFTSPFPSFWYCGNFRYARLLISLSHGAV